MALPIEPVDREPGGGGHAPFKPPVGKSTIQGSPGLLTSTGGLFGANYQLLMPLFDATFQKTYLALFNDDDFNCEEAAFYTFRQEDVQPFRNVSVHKLIINYRELGEARFTIGVQAYIEDTDSFKTESRLVRIVKAKNRKGLFPDKTLRTKQISLVISGQRPQIFISREPNSGPLSITRVMMVGKADQKDFV